MNYLPQGLRGWYGTYVGKNNKRHQKYVEEHVKSDAQKVNSNYIEWSAGVCGN